MLKCSKYVSMGMRIVIIGIFGTIALTTIIIAAEIIFSMDRTFSAKVDYSSDIEKQIGSGF